MLTGQVPDISPLLKYKFNEPFYYRDSNQVPGESTEALGYWVGMAPNVGHAMTYKILTADTRKIIVHDPAYVLLRSKKQRTYISSRHGKSYSVRLISRNGLRKELFNVLPTFSADLHHHAR
jgi:hypothetical protein